MILQCLFKYFFLYYYDIFCIFSYTVPKKEATEFTKELVNKVENSTLKVAVEKALLFLEKNELPPHWDRDSLFGHSVSSGNSDSDGELDSDVRCFFLVIIYCFHILYKLYLFCRVLMMNHVKKKIIL